MEMISKFNFQEEGRRDESSSSRKYFFFIQTNFFQAKLIFKKRGQLLPCLVCWHCFSIQKVEIKFLFQIRRTLSKIGNFQLNYRCTKYQFSFHTKKKKIVISLPRSLLLKFPCSLPSPFFSFLAPALFLITGAKSWKFKICFSHLWRHFIFHPPNFVLPFPSVRLISLFYSFTF